MTSFCCLVVEMQGKERVHDDIILLSRSRAHDDVILLSRSRDAR